jgi:glycosyltransferase involved in cell wall biosynthesis
MIRRGHSATVLCAGGPPMPPVGEWIDSAGVPVRILTRTPSGSWKDTLFAIRVAWFMWRRRHTYDLAYFLMQGLQIATGVPIARAVRKPVVMKISGSNIIPMMQRSRAGRLELKWLRKWAARLLVLNDGMVDEALAAGFNRKQLMWMPNPVDTDEFRPGTPEEVSDLRRRFDLPRDAVLAIYVGRLAPEKGLLELVRGFAEAARCSATARLVIVGDGPTRSAVEALARELGIADRARFVGRVATSEVPLWLRAADIFCLTSPAEGFPCALAEAMGAGLPSVVSRIPGNVQLIDDDVHGLTVPFDDPPSIGQALERLTKDPDCRRRMGDASRRRIMECYSTSKIAELYEDLFMEAVKRTPAK